MSLEARFRVLVFVQVVLGITAFCLAEANLGLMLIAGSLALASWHFSQGPHGRPLPRWLVNAGSLVAMSAMLLEVSSRPSGLIVAMGHFTMALQLLMLYGRKGNREYSMLLVLSLIQMIGASVLSVSVVYGVLLATYCGLALVTVLLFQIKATGDGVHQRRGAAAWRAGVAERPRRPAVVSGRGMRWHLRGVWAGAGVLAGVLALGVFVALPRSGSIPALGVQTGGESANKRTGFSPTVSLAGGAPRDGSTDAVLNLAVKQFGDNAGGDHRAFLLRGAALDHYDPRAHQWRRGPRVAQAERKVPLPKHGKKLAGLAQDYAALEATVTLRNPSPRVLFVPAEPRMSGGALGWINSPHLDQVTFNPVDRQVFAGELKTSAITYQMRVAGLLSPGVQAQYEQRYLRRPDEAAWSSPRSWMKTPSPWPQDERAGLGPKAWEPGWLHTRYARDWFIEADRVRALVREVLAERGLSRDPSAMHSESDVRIATALADYLQRNHRYDLNNPRATPGSDPVIDFLFDHKAGHCELFASALAVMCRSINIPARVITGYRASEYNALGGYYVVRQTHAHAWTEVDCGPGVGWRTYDATPAAQVRAEHAVTGPGWFNAVREVYEYVEFTWVRSVVAYDERTRQALMRSVNRRFTRTVTAAEGLPARLWLWTLETFGGLRLKSIGAVLLLVGAVLLAFTGASVAGAMWRRRRRRAALRLDRMPPAQARRMTRQLHFYLDLICLLESHGYRRPRWQSPAAYARSLERVDPAIALPATSLVALFYRIRFGQQELDAGERERVQEDLRELEAVLIAKPGG